jgi:pyruvate formate lyase activating enzyme
MFTENQMNAPAGALIKTTLVDFPGRVACTLFVKGCNLRCPYCYNVELVVGANSSQKTESHEQSATNHSSSDTFAKVKDVLAHLEKRRRVLTGFVISGGEPLLNPLTPDLIRFAKKLGYKIKLDTNGTLPDKLQQFLEDPELKPDFVAMDIKTNPSRYESVVSQKAYAEHVAHTKNEHAENIPFADRLSRSAKMISTLPPDCREWRTVLVPTMVEESDIDAIAAMLPKDASWQFAQFRNENCIDPRFNDMPPYIDADLKQLVAHAKSLIPGAELR